MSEGEFPNAIYPSTTANTIRFINASTAGAKKALGKSSWAPGSHDNFYDYEKEFAQIWLETGKEVLERNLGDVSEGRRQKSIETRFGPVALSHEHANCKPDKGFRHSPYFQKLVVYAGHINALCRPLRRPR